jgi:hypothetical protein
MEAKKLLNEQAFAEGKVLTEDAGNGAKRMYITGPFLQAVDKNRNGRVYPRAIIEREVNKFQALIESREALGELNHPDTIEINPREAAIMITELKMDGNVAIGKAKVLHSPNGLILESLLQDGVRIGVSSRGTGNLCEDNTVADDYSMATIDAVYMPSAQCAYTDPIYESVQYVTKWVLNEKTGLYVEQQEKIVKAQEAFNKTVDKHGSKVVMSAFRDFLRAI